MLKQIGSDIDPVELGEGEVTELITVLQALVKHIWRVVMPDFVPASTGRSAPRSRVDRGTGPG